MDACHHLDFRPVPVKVAFPENAAATWSLGDILTLNLALDELWTGPIERWTYGLLLHGLAHQDAFHQGRSFPREVEGYAGATVEAMLDRGEEA